MKNAKKVLLLLLCAVLLVGATVAGTVAYLTSNAKVENTFTVGNVAITMDEAKVDEYGVAVAGANRVQANTYKLLPGHTYTKDPTVKVDANSEDCFVFVKIENGLGVDGTLAMNTGWTLVTGQTNVWVYGTNEEPVSVEAGTNNLTPFSTFKFGENAKPSDHTDSKIVVTAYAIQADTLEAKSAAELWTLLNK